MKKLLLFAFVLGYIGLSAQTYLGFYNFDHVNQNLLINPASPHNYRFVIGVPGLSGVGAHVNNSAFELGDFAEKGSDANQKLEDAISGLNGKERINLYEKLDGIFVGFGTKKGYWTIGASQSTTFNMTFPSELVQFLYFGNIGSGYAGNTLSMDNFNTDLTVRNEYHIGYQHYVDSNLIIGGRYKYISGIGNFSVDRFKFDIYSDIDEITVSTDILFQASSEVGLPSLDEDSDFEPEVNPTSMLMSRNSGMGFDLGVYYRINDRFDVSASVLDLGWTTWRKNLKGYQSKGTYTFEGLQIDAGDSTDFETILENMLDSLTSELEFKEVALSEYTTTLPTKIMASGQFHLTPKHCFGLVYQGSLWNNTMYHNYGIQYIGRYGKWFNWILGYSVIDGAQKNLTLGLSLRLGPVQIYALTENGFGVIEPNSIRNTSVFAGLNLSFYDKPFKKKKEQEEQINTNE